MAHCGADPVRGIGVAEVHRTEQVHYESQVTIVWLCVGARCCLRADSAGSVSLSERCFLEDGAARNMSAGWRHAAHHLHSFPTRRANRLGNAVLFGPLCDHHQALSLPASRLCDQEKGSKTLWVSAMFNHYANTDMPMLARTLLGELVQMAPSAPSPIVQDHLFSSRLSRAK